MLFKFEEKFSFNSFERKLKKLKKNPELFVKDMIANKKEQVQETINKVSPIKGVTKNKFTIVSAVYNVSKYLDDYFESIVNQSVDFKKSIKIICVDDGSTDSSADIIKKWQKKYPKNIQYIYKENGGQSSARNLGLDYVKTDWVIFTDPDDFLHLNYFKNIDNTLQKNNKVKMIVTNIIFYFEKNKLKKDTHSLKYRFHGKCKVFDMKSLEANMNLSVATSLFYMPYIIKYKCKFYSEIKPNFEDGKFIADYMLASDGHIVFLKDSIYYYRKRGDNSSTLDNAWKKPEKFYNVLKYGHLDMLITYKEKLGVIPLHIQRTALYDMAWYINYLMNNDHKIDFLTLDQKNEFLKLAKNIFSYIDDQVILDFELVKMWFMYKVAMLGFFKNSEPQSYIAYIENIDLKNKQILISYYVYHDNEVSYKINNCDVFPQYIKTVRNNFVGYDFVYEKRAWISYNDVNDTLEVLINNRKAKISLFGKQYKDGLLLSHILAKFSPSLKYDSDDSWILMDRNTQADDNAEHLYRYILENNLKDDCYFALNRDSSDWERLSQEGFKLLEFGSQSFEQKLNQCSKIISSHFDEYVTNYFGNEYEYSKKIIFLQHGVTHNDLSPWLNSKRNLHCVIAATQSEYQSMTSNNTRYKLTEKEVVLTGFPRHDRLLKQNLDEKIILIMPTWRNSIVGKSSGKGNERTLNEDFMETLYAQSWYKMIHSQQLKNLVDQYSYKVIFAPHANIVPYLEKFEVPSYIEKWTANDQFSNIQKLFQKSKIMITDFSSVAFEMAYLEKAIIYYQFDQNTFYQGEHIFQKGYFEYERDGFGPVVEEVEQVEQALEQILQNNGGPLPKYLTRMQDTFKFKDGRCCERVYNAIVALDHEDNSENLELAHIFLNQAYEFENYALVRERAENILLHPDLSETDKQAVYAKLAESYIQLKDFNALAVLLEDYQNDYYVAKWLETLPNRKHILDITGSNIIPDEYFELRISCLFNLNQLRILELEKILDNSSEFNVYQLNLLQCYYFYLNKNWLDLGESLSKVSSLAQCHGEFISLHVRNDLLLMKLAMSRSIQVLDSSN